MTGWLLVAVVALPAIGALALLAGARRLGDRAATVLGAVIATVGLALAVGAAWPVATAGWMPSIDRPWIPALGVRLHLQLDGVSAPLLLLTALLTLLACGHLALSARRDPDGPDGPALGPLVACVLAVQAGAAATFLAMDLVVFFVAFETVLVPMWFVIDRWGDAGQPATTLASGVRRPGGVEARRDAANRFVLFTVTGSALMLLGILLVAVRAGTTDLAVLAQARGSGLSPTVQVVAAVLLVTGLAVKAPMFPLHTWLPPAHTVAPTVGSVLLAGVLLKMGTYGLVRLVVPVVPDGLAAVAPVLGALGVAGVLWAGLACFVERDLKRLIALSSVAHMGFVLLGIATMTPQGLQGALFANVAHGLVTGLLFFLVGAVKERWHTADLPRLAVELGALRDRAPRLGWLVAFGALAGLGLPGLAGFWGELLAIAGAWSAASAVGPLTRLLAVLAAVGTVVAAAYLLRMLRLLWHGEGAPDDASTSVAGAPSDAAPSDAAPSDATRGEVAVAAPLVAATVVLGLAPGLLLGLTGPAVRLVLGGQP